MPHPPAFELPERPDPVLDASLLVRFCDDPGQVLDINARARQRLDVPLLQILLMARCQRQAQGGDLRLTGLGPNQMARLHLLGLTPDLLITEEDADALPVFASARGAR